MDYGRGMLVEEINPAPFRGINTPQERCGIKYARLWAFEGEPEEDLLDDDEDEDDEDEDDEEDEEEEDNGDENLES